MAENKTLPQLDQNNTLDESDITISFDVQTGKTKRNSWSQVIALFLGIKSVNGQLPDPAGAVTLNPDNLSDATTTNKFVSQAQKNKIELIKTDGDGSKVLANNGQYVTVSGGTGGGSSIDDTTASLTTTYSSSKIVALIDAVVALYDSLVTSLSGKVDKITGKGLSTEDYTTAEKNKLAGLSQGGFTSAQSVDISAVTSTIDVSAYSSFNNFLLTNGTKTITAITGGATEYGLYRFGVGSGQIVTFTNSTNLKLDGQLSLALNGTDADYVVFLKIGSVYYQYLASQFGVVTAASFNTILNGTTNPVSGTGSNGDFYINTATTTIFGPKASGSWPSGVSLVGSNGVGVPSGGTAGQVLSKIDGTNYNTQWVTPSAGGGSGVTTVGTLDGGTANATGATISTTTIFLQSASATVAGLVNIVAQSFTGVKTFLSGIVLGASTTTQASMKFTSGVAKTSPTDGDVYYTTDLFFRKGSVTTKFVHVDANSAFAGTGSRMVQVDSSGNMVAANTVSGMKITDSTAITNITNTSNWSSGVYTGAALSNCIEGQEYRNSAYLFRMYSDTEVIRIARV